MRAEWVETPTIAAPQRDGATWSEAATKAQDAFKRGDNAALLGDKDKAITCIAESRAWLEIMMHRLGGKA